jgi:hypothetical protein
MRSSAVCMIGRRHQPASKHPPVDCLPTFWRLSCAVGFLRCVPIAIAYRALQDCDRRPIAGRAPEGGKAGFWTFGIVNRAIGDAPELYGARRPLRSKEYAPIAKAAQGLPPTMTFRERNR